MDMLYGDITQKILEACSEVTHELGSGFLESVYQNALGIAFVQKDLKVKSQHPAEVMFRGQIFGQFYIDFVVEDKAIVEIKSVSALLPEHHAQVINYLRATNLEISILINFGKPKLEYKRLYKSPKPTLSTPT